MTAYKLSQSEKAEITKILQNTPNDAAIKANPNSALTLVQEQLTQKKAGSLCGQNCICLYDNEKQTLITTHYRGIALYWDADHTIASQKLKTQFEERFPEFELVAQVTMQVAEPNYPGEQTWSTDRHAVNFSATGTGVVCNLIIRNRRTNTLELFNTTRWFGVAQYNTPDATSRASAYSLPRKISKMPNFLNNLLNGRNAR